MAWSKGLQDKTREILAKGGIAGAAAFMKNLDGRYGIAGREGGIYVICPMPGDELRKAGGEPEIFTGLDALIESGWVVD
jgi:hypothetical protein